MKRKRLPRKQAHLGGGGSFLFDTCFGENKLYVPKINCLRVCAGWTWKVLLLKQCSGREVSDWQNVELKKWTMMTLDFHCFIGSSFFHEFQTFQSGDKHRNVCVIRRVWKPFHTNVISGWWHCRTTERRAPTYFSRLWHALIPYIWPWRSINGFWVWQNPRKCQDILQNSCKISFLCGSEKYCGNNVLWEWQELATLSS